MSLLLLTSFLLSSISSFSQTCIHTHIKHTHTLTKQSRHVLTVPQAPQLLESDGLAGLCWVCLAIEGASDDRKKTAEKRERKK